ncbi:MAG: hypothetical protein RL141_505 [Candidatus Parcubacteria bacterium]|jgi:GTP-binding protein
MPQQPSTTRFITSYADPTEIPAGGLPQVAFLGRSNAGKSSLINALTGIKKLAHVSATPGRTQLVNIFEVEGAFQLVDLPGYGFAKGSRTQREQMAERIYGYLRSARSLRLVVLIIDSRLGPTPADQAMIEQLQYATIPLILVVNKVDKLSRLELTQRMGAVQAAYPGVTVIAHSTITGVGKDALMQAIRDRLAEESV